MSKRIRYSLTLMSICILGVILTQGYWLYKDYSYYRGQPLFSSDYSFYSRVMPTMPMPMGTVTPRIAELPAIIAYPSVPAVKLERGMMARIVPRHYLAAGVQAKKIPDGVYNTVNEVPLTAVGMIATRGYAPATTPGTPADSAYAVNTTLKMANTDIPFQAVSAVPAFTINSELYKNIPYQAPLTHILQKMKWQFGASILLVLFTISCFIYMLITIFMQRKISSSKNDFINNMTHELKTPLATVSVAIEAMRNFGALEDKKKTNHYLDISKKELDHLSKMIEMIMQLSVYESHKMELVLKKHKVNALIESVIEKYTLTKEKGIVINLIQSPFVFYMQIDATHISNALRNLIDNSIKYSNPGVIININSSFKDHEWILSVEDNGFGIPKKYQKDVFERFFRVIDEDKPIIKGFGLGLPYVKQVVELHGGDITLQSQEGKGTNFIISIPVIS